MAASISAVVDLLGMHPCDNSDRVQNSSERVHLVNLIGTRAHTFTHTSRTHHTHTSYVTHTSHITYLLRFVFRRSCRNESCWLCCGSQARSHSQGLCAVFVLFCAHTSHTLHITHYTHHTHITHIKHTHSHIHTHDF